MSPGAEGGAHLMALRHRERLRGVHLKPQRTTKWNSENGAGPSLPWQSPHRAEKAFKELSDVYACWDFFQLR